MSLETRCTEDIVVVRASQTAAVTDAEGVSRAPGSAEKTYKGRIDQRDASEQLGAPDVQTSDYLLTLTLDPDVAADALPRGQLHPRDHVRRGAQTFEVVGEPDVPRGPLGPHHIEAELRLVTTA